MAFEKDTSNPAVSWQHRLSHDVRWYIACFVGGRAGTKGNILAQVSMDWYDAIARDKDLWSEWAENFGFPNLWRAPTTTTLTTSIQLAAEDERDSRANAITFLQIEMIRCVYPSHLPYGCHDDHVSRTKWSSEDSALREALLQSIRKKQKDREEEEEEEEQDTNHHHSTHFIGREDQRVLTSFLRDRVKVVKPSDLVDFWKDPQTVLVNLNQLDDTSAFPPWFLKNSSLLRFLRVPISLSATLVTIGSNFAEGSPQLSHVSLASLHNLQHIGHHFLANCPNLEEVDMTKLLELKVIESRCFWQSSSRLADRVPILKTVDLRDSTQLETVGEFPNWISIQLPSERVTATTLNNSGRSSSCTREGNGAAVEVITTASSRRISFEYKEEIPGLSHSVHLQRV